MPGIWRAGQDKADVNDAKDTVMLRIPLDEKIHVIEMYPDQGHSLLAVGLKSGLAIIGLVLDDEDALTGYQTLVRLDHDSRVHCIAWSPETTLVSAPKLLRFATGGADHNVRIYSTDLGESDTMRVLKGHTDYVNAVAFQPDSGGQLASGSDDHSVVMWDAQSGRKLDTMHFQSAVMSLSWHPDEVSKLLVAEKSGVLHIVNAVSFHSILSLDCGGGPLSSADWSLYNNTLISAAVRSDVIVWDLSKMAPVAKKHTKQEVIKSVKMSPIAESAVATAGQPNYSVKISSIKNTHLSTVSLGQPVGGIAWHPRKSYLAVGHDQTVSVHHIPNKMLI